jgi:signal transduction histidine kinase
MKKSKIAQVWLALSSMYFGQIVPLFFILIDLWQLNLPFSLTNISDIYRSQYIYAFSSFAMPFFIYFARYFYQRNLNQQEFYFSILENTHDAIAVIENNKSLVFSNTHLKKIFPNGLPQDLLNKTDLSFFEWKHSSSERDAIYLCTNNQLGAQSSISVLALTDITALRESERAIMEKNNQLQENSHLINLGEMAAGIAHEINNPLGIIRGSVELIRADQTHSLEFLNKHLMTIDRMIDRMASIIRSMRNLSRRAASKKIEIINIRQLLQDVHNLSLINLKNLEVNGRFIIDDLPTDSMVEGQAAQLSQVFLNLINNSAQAVSGKYDSWIELKAFVESDRYVFWITDSGKGIPLEHQSKIFMPFFTTKEVGKGTGIGLSLSKNIVEVHRGTLTLDTKCENTRFVIELPAYVNQSEESDLS